LPALALAAAVALGGCSRDAGPAAAGAPATTTTTEAPPTTATPTTATATATTRAATTTTAATTTRPAELAAPLHYRFPVAGCPVHYGRSHHDYPATDIFAARGCAFVAPVDGRVDEVSTTDRWSPASNRGADRGGRSVSIVGVDGVRYYGSHLEAIAPGIAPGVRVRAGRLLGRVGNSGSARVTAVHLHFAISWPTRPGVWWIRRGVVYPWRYLDSWRAGGDLSPAPAVRAARAAAGSQVPPCQALC
jgi:murein DD-endopeptidase MepM/ murein hydrolase activator NlpD